jgi:hypothetical protein
LRLYNPETFLLCLQSSHFDGKMPYWYHKECFFQKQKPKALGDIAKLDAIRAEDQEYIKNQIANSSNGNGSTPQGNNLGAPMTPESVSISMFILISWRQEKEGTKTQERWQEARRLALRVRCVQPRCLHWVRTENRQG